MKACARAIRTDICASPSWLTRCAVSTRTTIRPLSCTPVWLPGDQVEIIVAPKGGGSENMSALKMFTPAATRDQIVAYIADTVIAAGSNPCPPVIIGVGLGGTADKASELAKAALLRPVDTANTDPFYAEMERDILERVNRSGVGPQGLGGTVTALACAIEPYPTPYRKLTLRHFHWLPHHAPRQGVL